MRKFVVLIVFVLCLSSYALAQELNARVLINHQQVQGTNSSVFESLQNALSEFINTRQWTNLHYSIKERIVCTFNITVSRYDANTGQFVASLQVQSNRPIYNASLNTTTWAFKDPNFDFTYREFDPLTFREDQIDNNLTALLAYYIYLIIGIDMDTMSPNGGTNVLQTVQNIVNSAQTLDGKGWKAFESSSNRYAIITDYLEGSMAPLRALQYKYHREGLDEMAENTERGRAAVYEAIKLLEEVKQNKPLSQLPQIFTEYKGEEIANIFSGKGTMKEREEVKRILMDVNPSMSNTWNKIK